MDPRFYDTIFRPIARSGVKSRVYCTCTYYNKTIEYQPYHFTHQIKDLQPHGMSNLGKIYLYHSASILVRFRPVSSEIETAYIAVFAQNPKLAFVLAFI